MKHLDLELEAHTWWFYSTHVHYKTTKYELSVLRYVVTRFDGIMENQREIRKSTKFHNYTTFLFKNNFVDRLGTPYRLYGS